MIYQLFMSPRKISAVGQIERKYDFHDTTTASWHVSAFRIAGPLWGESPMFFPHIVPEMLHSDISFMLATASGWTNSREDDDLARFTLVTSLLWHIITVTS